VAGQRLGRRTHIHHLVWGILLLLISGYIAVAIAPDSPWREIVAVFFGIGHRAHARRIRALAQSQGRLLGEAGRRSIDAVIIAAAVSGVLLISLRGWIDVTTKVADEIQAIVGAVGLLGVILALLNAAKEKFGMAIWSVLVPVVGLSAGSASPSPTPSGRSSSTATASWITPSSATRGPAPSRSGSGGTSYLFGSAPPQPRRGDLRAPARRSRRRGMLPPEWRAGHEHAGELGPDDHRDDRDRRFTFSAPPL